MTSLGRVLKIGRVALLATVASAVFAPVADAAFGVSGFSARVEKADTTLETQAGGHPYVGITAFTFNATGNTPDGNVRDVRVDLPAGLISNPQATPTCTDTQLAASACPASSQLGTEEIVAVLTVLPVTIKVPIYNMVPAAGRISDFAFSIPVAGRTDIVGGIRDTGDYGLYFTISDVSNAVGLLSSKLTFWGVPADSSHDAERGQTCTGGICAGGNTASSAPHDTFLTNPTACGPPLTTKLAVDSYQDPGTFVTATDTTPTGVSGCGSVPFHPSISVQPDTTQQDSPTGVNVDLHVPQTEDPNVLGTAHVKDVSVTLPPGLTIDPSAANGLAACTDAQIGLGTADPITCPAASKIGTASIATPLLPDALTGSVYLGQPQPSNPYRIFLAVGRPGVQVRLAGNVTADPATGQLTAVFANNPQVPFSDFVLHFDGGPHATLANPLACGAATTTTTLTPYSGNPAATPTGAYAVDADGHGAACPVTPFTLGFSAGTASRQAGASTPFTLDVARADGQQYLSKISIQQPRGLLGMLASVPLCPEAQAARGTCPSASHVGGATVAAGAGDAPFKLPGSVFLTGPHAGAPFGLSIVIHAVAGPFDLGTVVVRAGIRVDPGDAHLTIDSDPLPAILQGIPLRLRAVTVAIDRSGFIFNPSSCDALAVTGTLTSTTGTVQQVTTPFQATGCDKLPFAPQVTASTTGNPTSRTGAGLSVTLTVPSGNANVKSVAVALPRQLTARGTTVRQSCAEATFRADPRTCPPASVVGSDVAATPVTGGTLGGPVYLVSHQGALPTLEALLQGDGISVGLSGSITFAPTLTSTFAAVPDVPISTFRLDLPQGPHSALSALGNLCTSPLVMPTTITGHNGRQISQNTPISVPDCGLKIISASIRRHTATLKVQIPVPGSLRARGSGLHTVHRTLKRPVIATVKVPLSRTGRRHLAQRRRSHHKLVLHVSLQLTATKAGPKLAGASTARKRVVFVR